MHVIDLLITSYQFILMKIKLNGREGNLPKLNITYDSNKIKQSYGRILSCCLNADLVESPRQ